MTIIIYTDGAARGNPGPAAIGAIGQRGNETLFELSKAIGETTNNDAEYQAAIAALKKLKQTIGKKEAKKSMVQVRMDSELVVKQLHHQYKVDNDLLQQHFLELWNLMLDFGQVTVAHVPREENKQADALANAALDQGTLPGIDN